MTDDLDTAIRDLYEVPPEDPEALRRVRAHVLAQTRNRPAAARRWWLGAAAVVLAVAVVAVAVRENTPRGPLIEVTQALNSAADLQIRAVDEPVPAGWYRYIATHSLNTGYGNGVAVLSGSRDERWVPADPAGEWFQERSDTGERTRLLGTDAQVKAAGLDRGITPERTSGRCADPCAGNWQTPTATFVAALPRDPGKLFRRLRDDTEGHGRDPDQEVLVYVADALRSGLLPADLRAALYRALTRLPTLEITERAVTLDGRTGTALGIAAAGVRQEIVIDPATGAFVGERQKLTEEMDGVAAGTVVGSSTVRYAVVAKPWDRP